MVSDLIKKDNIMRSLFFSVCTLIITIVIIINKTFKHHMPYRDYY